MSYLLLGACMLLLGYVLGRWHGTRAGRLSREQALMQRSEHLMQRSEDAMRWRSK